MAKLYTFLAASMDRALILLAQFRPFLLFLFFSPKFRSLYLPITSRPESIRANLPRGKIRECHSLAEFWALVSQQVDESVVLVLSSFQAIWVSHAEKCTLKLLRSNHGENKRMSRVRN